MNAQDQIALDTEFASTTDPMKGVLFAVGTAGLTYAALSGAALFAQSIIG